MADYMNSFFSEVDAREEMNTVLEENGIKALYVRSNKDTRCKCYDPLHKDGEGNCHICGGSGFLSSIEPITVFANPLSQDDAGEKFTELGDANLYSNTFYLRYNAAPENGDRIIVVGYDNYGMPTQVKAVFVLGLCRAVRGHKGRIEHYRVLGRTSPQHAILEQSRLNKIPNAHKKNLMKGVRYQWGA